MDLHLEYRDWGDVLLRDYQALLPEGQDHFGVWELNLQWSTPTWHLLAWSSDALVGHLAGLERTVHIGEESVSLMGLTRLLVAPPYRGLGVASQLLAHALRRRESEPAFAMGFCREYLLPFYLTRGWQIVGDPVTITQPEGPRPAPLATVVWCPPGRPWPTGPVDIGGWPW